jgi:hypothetical protein
LHRFAAKALELKLDDRCYRTGFSQSYRKLLSKESSYLTELLDSAQEGFPHMWVNSEKYIFSEHVIEGGLALYK